MPDTSVSTCPVPAEQQPINEFRELQDSWFFGWMMLGWRGYIMKLVWLWGWSWLIAGPLAAASFAPQKSGVQFFLCGAAGAGAFVVLTLLRLYLGWCYVRDRLLKETIFYEESGWYDGQTWTKPSEILTRDRLIVSYQVQPILQRLQQTFGVLLLLVLGGSLIWNLV